MSNRDHVSSSFTAAMSFAGFDAENVTPKAVIMEIKKNKGKESILPMSPRSRVATLHVGPIDIVLLQLISK